MRNRSLQRSIALRIRSARRAARMTQGELASMLCVSRSAVAQWESANGSAPSTSSFAGLAAALGCSFEWLATGRGPRSPERRDGAAAAHDTDTVERRHFARDDDEEHLIEAFRTLDEFDRGAILSLAETLSGRPLRIRRQRLCS
jgi:transcriptional regulator with XRE-family HTH domain